MDRKNIDTVLRLYDSILQSEGYSPVCSNTSKRVLTKEEHLNHARWMCNEAIKEEDDIKAMRWLGYIQGVFGAFGVFSVDEMRAHNAPSKYKENIQDQISDVCYRYIGLERAKTNLRELLT